MFVQASGITGRLINGIVCFRCKCIETNIYTVPIKWMFTHSNWLSLCEMLVRYTVQLIIEIFLEISSLTFQSSKQENNPSCDCCQNVNSYHLTLAYCRSTLFSGNNKIINEFFIFIVRCWAQLYYCNCWWEKYHAWLWNAHGI